MAVHLISNKQLILQDLSRILSGAITVQLSEESKERINQCRVYLDEKLENSSDTIYGINTGFGSLYNKNISTDQLEKLQENLVKSHACGTGPEVPEEIVKLMIFLKVQSLAYGYSGVQLVTVERLVAMFNEDVLPRIYEMGSLGASGDLAPLAHLALPLIGLGEIHYQKKVLSAEAINRTLGWSNLHFQAKEGLALLNGTQFMSAYGVWCVLHAHKLLRLSSAIGALSLDSFDGRLEPFLPFVHALRPHPGQVRVATEIRGILEGSELIHQPKRHVQDPYSFRCIPQVHGASADTIDHVTNVFLVEVNSVTDNPNIFPGRRYHHLCRQLSWAATSPGP